LASKTYTSEPTTVILPTTDWAQVGVRRTVPAAVPLVFHIVFLPVASYLAWK
jgi:hypothetical protein